MSEFSTDCTACPRLAAFLADMRAQQPGYFARPVPPFGADKPRLLIVGLAPGMHGANRTGRPFTGDYAGVLLYETLHRFGFSSAPVSLHAEDGLELIGCRITNAVKCLPPQNKPEPSEIIQCNSYLKNEIKVLNENVAVLALGQIAHKAVVAAEGLRQKDLPFAHGALHKLPHGRALFDSYHCSRYNTQTKRLTPEMFRAVFEAIRNHLDRS
jgi:uracil-DNA glycosylase family 4